LRGREVSKRRSMVKAENQCKEGSVKEGRNSITKSGYVME